MYQEVCVPLLPVYVSLFWVGAAVFADGQWVIAAVFGVVWWRCIVYWIGYLQ